MLFDIIQCFDLLQKTYYNRNKMNFFKYIFVLVFLFSCTYISNFQVSAQNTPIPTIPNVCDNSYFGDGKTGVCKDRGGANGNQTLTQSVVNIVNTLNNTLLILGPSIGVLAIIYGAFKIIANGFKAGIVIIQYALIGIVVILLSSGLLSLILRVFL